jgi:hypothetical protein
MHCTFLLSFPSRHSLLEYSPPLSFGAPQFFRVNLLRNLFNSQLGKFIFIRVFRFLGSTVLPLRYARNDKLKKTAFTQLLDPL